MAAPAKGTRPPDQEEAGWGTHRPQAPNPGRSIPLISASVRQLASLSSRRLTDHGRCWARIPAYDDRVQLRATLIVGLWILWALIWIATAIVFRPDSPDSTPRRRRGMPRRQLWFRLILAAFILVAIRTHHVGGTSAGSIGGWIGVAVCVAGFAVATWARICLGQSWGMPMTVRTKTALVRRGPYRVVRHPIYSGLLIALLGSGLATGPGGSSLSWPAAPTFS